MAVELDSRRGGPGGAIARGARRPARTVPRAALLLSLGTFVIPLASSLLFSAAGGLLLWVAALVPAFLLSYYRRWIASAVALAAGMAVIPAWALALWWLELPTPSWDRVMLLVSAYLVFCAGLGVVTELLRRERRSAEMAALTDPLTELPNRQHLDALLPAFVASASAADAPLSFVIFDVDRFAWLVGAHGRSAGDEVLRSLSDLLRERAGPGWLCARFGEDELALVVPRATRAETTFFAETLRADVGRLDLRWQPLTVSAGVVALGGEIRESHELVAAAEAALRAAKSAGRDRLRAAVGAPAIEPPERGPAATETPPLPRGLVALEAAKAQSVRRVLELNGLGVEEYEELSQIPSQLGAHAPPAILVTAAPARARLGEVLRAVDHAVDASVARVVFLEDLGDDEPLPRVPGATILRGKPHGEPLLPLLGGLLAVAPARPAASPEAGGGLMSKLARADAPLTAARIMIVEDERATSAALRRALEGIGFRDIVLVESGEEALARIWRKPPDLLILDLHMPGIGGFAVLETLRRHLDGNGFLPVLVVTGDQNWEHRQRALRVGAKDFLNKPFDVSELGARVLNLLETRKLHLQLRDTNALLEVRVLERTRQLGLAKNEILFRLARAAEYRDDMTGRHAERVGVAAAILGEAMGLGAPRCETLRQSAPLHDVGKIGIPDAILLKPGRLTEEETLIMRSHTTIGADLLAQSTSEVIEEARLIALTHHERWDGTGYPFGLVGEEIPVQGRLVALADGLDALTHRRPYKRALPYAQAEARLIGEAGTAFDPAVVEALQVTSSRIRDVMLEPASAPAASPAEYAGRP